MKKTIGKMFYRGGVFHHTKSYSDFAQRFSSYQGKKIINVGSGGHDSLPNVVNVDPYRGGPDTVKAFGEDMPFENGSIDLALCIAVLEHVKEPGKIVDEIKRVLKSDGEIYVEIPFLQPFHAAPDDYQRWTMNGLKFLLRDFDELDSGVAGGPGSAIAWIAVEASQVLFINKFLNKIAKNITKIFVSPLKYLDVFLVEKPNTYKVASALYFHGKKK